MKNINKLIKTMFSLSLLTLLFISCDDDEYVAPGSFTDLSITWTSGASSARESEVNRFFSFSDISAGAEYSEWRIPSNAFFLQGPIPNNLDNHDAYIVNPGDTVSSEKTVHVLWKKGDSLTEVKYYGIFNDSTSFRFNLYYDTEINSDVEDTIKTVNINGKWIADYTFIIDVYDTVVAVPEVRYMDGTVLDHENTDAVTLTFGDQLIFEDLSGLQLDNNARPETTKWRVHTRETDTTNQTNVYNNTITRVELRDRVIDTITFDDLGEYQVELRATRERTERLKQNFEVYDIPTVFTVVPLNDPFTYIGDVVESNADIIQIDLSHKIRPLTENVAGNFSVKVDGVAKTIESVSRNSNGTKLLIALVDPIVPQDATKTVTVSYDGGNADLRSYDERLLEAFTNLPIDVYVPTPTFQTGDVIELENETIQISFQDAIDAASFGDAVTGFEVLVNGSAFAISTVTLDAGNPKTINIKLTNPIINTDEIFVSYDGSGSIYAVGDGAVTPFSNLPVKMNIIDILNGDGSFNDGAQWTNAGNTPGVDSNISVVTPSVPNSPDTGTVMFIEAIDGKKADLRSTGTYSYESGVTYILKFKRYLFAEHTTAFAKIYLGGTQIKPDPEQYGGAATGVWEEVSYEFTYTGGSVDNILRIQPIPVGVCKVYYDDMILYKKESR